jgi:hypothetical protein
MFVTILEIRQIVFQLFIDITGDGVLLLLFIYVLLIKTFYN